MTKPPLPRPGGPGPRGSTADIRTCSQNWEERAGIPDPSTVDSKEAGDVTHRPASRTAAWAPVAQTPAGVSTDKSPMRKLASSYINRWTDHGPCVPGSRARTLRPLLNGDHGWQHSGFSPCKLVPVPPPPAAASFRDPAAPPMSSSHPGQRQELLRPTDWDTPALGQPPGSTALPTGATGPCHVPATAPADTKHRGSWPFRCVEHLSGSGTWYNLSGPRLVRPPLEAAIAPPSASRARVSSTHSKPSEEHVPLWPLHVTQLSVLVPCSSHREPGSTDGGDNWSSYHGEQGTSGHELSTLSSGATEEVGGRRGASLQGQEWQGRGVWQVECGLPSQVAPTSMSLASLWKD